MGESYKKFATFITELRMDHQDGKVESDALKTLLVQQMNTIFHGFTDLWVMQQEFFTHPLNPHVGDCWWYEITLLCLSMVMPEHWGQYGVPFLLLFMAAMDGSGDDENWPRELSEYDHQAA